MEARSRLEACFGNAAFEKELRHAWRDFDDEGTVNTDWLIDRLGEIVGKKGAAKQNCERIAAERFQKDHSPAFTDPWSTRNVDAVLSAPEGDCPALAKNLPVDVVLPH